MSIAATTPTAIPAADYNLWAFEFRTMGDGCVNAGEAPTAARPITAEAILTKFRARSDGASERSPLPADRIRVVVPDIYGLAATNPTVATALQALITAVQAIAQAQGVL